MTEKNRHVIKQFPSSRQLTLDVGYLGLRRHHMKALIELDVTDARALMKKNEKKEKPSFTAWILKCISQAIDENKSVQAIRKGKNKLIIFDDVDISIMIEKECKGEKVPLPVVIRKVNEKTLRNIDLEIKSAKKQQIIDEKDYVLGKNRYKWAMNLFVALPQFLRLIIWKHILKNPITIKEMMGTVLVTSVGMRGNVKGWAIPVSLHPICFVLGSIIKKPGVWEKQIEIRQYLQMTILIDHDVVDGVPAARFVSHLTDLIESGYGLQNTELNDHV